MTKFWHLFFHSWGRWQALTIHIEKGHLTPISVSGQARFCNVCNKEQIRKLRY